MQLTSVKSNEIETLGHTSIVDIVFPRARKQYKIGIIIANYFSLAFGPMDVLQHITF